MKGAFIALLLGALLAGCASGPSDQARAWCKDHSLEVSYAAEYLNVNEYQSQSAWDQACAYAFKQP